MCSGQELKVATPIRPGSRRPHCRGRTRTCWVDALLAWLSLTVNGSGIRLVASSLYALRGTRIHGLHDSMGGALQTQVCSTRDHTQGNKPLPGGAAIWCPGGIVRLRRRAALPHSGRKVCMCAQGHDAQREKIFLSSSIFVLLFFPPSSTRQTSITYATFNLLTISHSQPIAHNKSLARPPSHLRSKSIRIPVFEFGPTIYVWGHLPPPRVLHSHRSTICGTIGTSVTVASDFPAHESSRRRLGQGTSG